MVNHEVFLSRKAIVFGSLVGATALQGATYALGRMFSRPSKNQIGDSLEKAVIIGIGALVGKYAQRLRNMPLRLAPHIVTGSAAPGLLSMRKSARNVLAVSLFVGLGCKAITHIYRKVTEQSTKKYSVQSYAKTLLKTLKFSGLFFAGYAFAAAVQLQLFDKGHFSLRHTGPTVEAIKTIAHRLYHG